MGEPSQPYRRIGDLAAELGVSPQTLRVWEAQGLVVPDRSERGQRLYTEAHVQRARQVAELRRRDGWNPAAIRAALAGGGAGAATKPRWNGTTIRRARRDHGLTVKEAAARIGVSPTFLSSLERGETGASTNIVARIADAFGMPMSGLANFRARDPRVVRRDERARAPFAGGVLWEELALPGHELEPALLTVPAGEGSGGSYERPGETFAFVLAGRLRFQVADAEIVVDDGDSIIVPSKTAYAWENPGPEPARALVVERVAPRAWDEPAAAKAVARSRRRAGP